MSANWFLLIFLFYVAKVYNKPVHKSVFGLSDILFVAHSACDAVYQVVAFARDVFTCLICSKGCGASDVATAVKDGAVVTSFVLTLV